MMTMSGTQSAPDPDSAFRRQLAQALPREVIADSIAGAMNAYADESRLRDGLAYLRSPAGRLQLACYREVGIDVDNIPACLKDRADECRHAQITGPEGLVADALLRGVMAPASLRDALSVATRTTIERDRSLQAGFRGFCGRKREVEMRVPLADLASEVAPADAQR